MKEKRISVDKRNFDKRQRFIVLHYTAFDEKDSLETLTRGGLSAHFLVPKQPFKVDEESYDYYKLVDINDRAWHAGCSHFKGRESLNDNSIGIEIVNYGFGLVQDSGEIVFTYQIEAQLKTFIVETLKAQHESVYQQLVNEKLLDAFLSDMQRSIIPPSDRERYKEKISEAIIEEYKKRAEQWRQSNDRFLSITPKDLYQLEQEKKLVWDDYTDHQYDTLVKLIEENIKPAMAIIDEESEHSYYQIPPQFILGHSDVAPGRKIDPGPRLWKKLAERNIGAWPDEAQVCAIEQAITLEHGIDYKWIQNALGHYGYDIDSTGQFDEQTQNVIRSFQMHFEPENYSGTPSARTISLLEALLKKYYPESMLTDYPRSFNLPTEKKS
ncbi:hypothetical protein BEV13_04380, partial [Rickettsiella grylli]|uniref:N-acetylmuramoyl-L-alanine amidase n=1 Tax=Rickettsiella grylli TaxID=59196 RepID=UPI0008FD47B4